MKASWSADGTNAATLVASLVLAMGVAVDALAQGPTFQVGDAVQFNICDPGHLPDRWRSGVVAGPARQTSSSPDLFQILVTETASQDYPQGQGQWNPEVRCVRLLTRSTASATDVKPLAWFLGKWDLAIVAPTVDRVHRDGYLYRREEYGAAMGFVDVRADRTYVWKILPGDPAAKWLHGAWRPATADEPGARIVLVKGEGGRDWIVHGSSAAVGGHDQVRLDDGKDGLQRIGVRE